MCLALKTLLFFVRWSGMRWELRWQAAKIHANAIQGTGYNGFGQSESGCLRTIVESHLQQEAGSALSWLLSGSASLLWCAGSACHSPTLISNVCQPGPWHPVASHFPAQGQPQGYCLKKKKACFASPQMECFTWEIIHLSLCSTIWIRMNCPVV